MKTILNNNKSLENANVPWKNPIKEDYHVAVYKDNFPVSLGHLLFVPKYDNPEVVKDAFYDAYQHGLALVKSGEIDGFNVGLNYGSAAGQTINYPHVHLIPRYAGDVKFPRGGVRNVIPGKGDY